MNSIFEPTDHYSLSIKKMEAEAALAQKTNLANSLIAENAGLLLAIDDAIELMIAFAGERGISADQAEALPIIKTLRTALNIPTTQDAIQTLVSKLLSEYENAPKPKLPGDSAAA